MPISSGDCFNAFHDADFDLTKLEELLGNMNENLPNAQKIRDSLSSLRLNFQNIKSTCNSQGGGRKKTKKNRRRRNH